MTQEDKRWVQKLRRIGPWAVLAIFLSGIVAWGGFNWALEATNTEQFCISCHEMRENVFKEYRHTCLLYTSPSPRD